MTGNWAFCQKPAVFMDPNVDIPVTDIREMEGMG